MFVTKKRVILAGLLLIALLQLVAWGIFWKSQHTITDDYQHIGTNRGELAPWSPPAVPEYIQKKEQIDTNLAEYIFKNWILPPSTCRRQLESPQQVDYSQHGQSTYVDNLLKQRKGGFFIECGATTGEGLSNSLFFEKERDWSGILIEANPLLFKELLQKQRHSYMLNACLSPTTQPIILDFTLSGWLGGLTNLMQETHMKQVQYENANNATSTKVQCFPLLSILTALKVSHVDYFSLDIEGAEFEVLKNFPFDKVQVDVITVEYLVIGNPKASETKKAEIIKLLVDKYGYHVSPFDSGVDLLLTKGV